MQKNPYQPKLTFVGEHFEGRVYELTQEKITVGRGSENTLVIHHPSISVVHCEILVNGAEVIVRDLGSANGCFVDAIRLSHQQCQLKSGQVLRLGAVSARLELSARPEDATVTEMTAVLGHRRAVREQEREKKESPLHQPGMTLNGGSTSSDPEKTLALGNSAPLRRNEDHFATAPAAAPPGRPAATSVVKIAAVVAAVLVISLVIWVILR